MKINTLINVYLASEGDDTLAPAGPGWYMYVGSHHPNGTMGDVIPRVRLTPQEVDSFVTLVEQSSQGKPLHPTPGQTQIGLPLREVIAKGNAVVRANIQAELNQAEAIATRIASLRRGLAEFEG